MLPYQLAEECLRLLSLQEGDDVKARLLELLENALRSSTTADCSNSAEAFTDGSAPEPSLSDEEPEDEE